MSNKNTETLFKAKLSSSGLDLKDAKLLGMTLHEEPRTLEPHFYNVPAFKIPYFDLKGKQTGFYRIRYLVSTKTGFAKAVKKIKERRYDQPSNDQPQIYVPHLLPKGQTWRDVANNPSVPIVFTEGELKAASATAHGIPCLALGGVWNFKSSKRGLRRLDAFSDIIFKGRTVYIIFDSDSATNSQVLHARYKFAEELFNLGAVPLVVNIPKIEGKKHGIDDYIVEFGIDAFKQLITDPANYTEFSFVKELLNMNSEIAIVQKPTSIVHFETGQLLSRADAQMLYANSKMIKQQLKAPTKKELDDDPSAKPTVQYKEAATFDEWLQWEMRNTVFAPVYEPGAPEFVEHTDKRCFNTWRGWGCTPEKGDVSLWKWLLDNIFKNAKPEELKWFIQWCAYPLQNPGVKMFTCPILFGQEKGTGKSLLGISLMSIYGDNGAEITDTQLEDERNVFAAEKQFVLANEVTGSDKRTMVGRLRNLITQHTVVINKKYQPDYTIRDTINYFFTSNHIDAVYMEDDERRFFVHEVLGPKLIDVDAKKVREYDAWLKSGQAARNIFYHLLNEVDCTGFDPSTSAPSTDSKRVMVEASRSEIEAWAFRMKEDPDTCLRSSAGIVPFKLYRIKEITDLFSETQNGKPVYEKTMANALRKAGFKKVAGDQSCPTSRGYYNLWELRPLPAKNLNRKEYGAYYDNERNFEKKEIEECKPKKFQRKTSTTA